ncbi:MAG: anti-sigma factor [Akkermansiaceae bacterium]
MSNQDILLRFEELEAGRILGDLDAEEIQEWENLSKDPRCQVDPALEIAAAAIEAEFSQGGNSELSEKLLSQLQEDISEFTVPESSTETVVQFAAWKQALQTPQISWAIAALFAILLVAQIFTKNNEPVSGKPYPVVAAKPSPVEARDAIIAKAGDLVQMDFGGTDAYAKMKGKVIWSDELQQGYMTLTNLPINDPGKKQYQLWIVDPNRDEKPVDGGVFDIPKGQNTAVIPIRNPLVVTDPKAFVITLEQPGGVVVSKQEDVVAIAKAS